MRAPFPSSGWSWALAWCLALVACTPSVGARRASLEGGRLLGPCDWPSVGQIDSSCTATLIGPSWILTAAHCPTGSRFRVGGSETGIARCERHPDFDGSGRVFDFMVCELGSPIDAPTVPLMSPCEAEELRGPDEPRVLPEGRPVFVVGLGAPSSGEKRGGEMEVSAFVYSSPLVSFWDPLELTGSRPGDSGGPTFLAMDDGTWRQVGVHHEGGVGPSVLDAFVPAAVDWIEPTTGLDTTPCHAGETWAPGDRCASLPSSLEGVGGTFPDCLVEERAPTPTCAAPGDAGLDAGPADADEPPDADEAPDADGLDAGVDADGLVRPDADPPPDGTPGDAGTSAPARGCGCRASPGSAPAPSLPRLLLPLIARSSHPGTERARTGLRGDPAP